MSTDAMPHGRGRDGFRAMASRLLGTFEAARDLVLNVVNHAERFGDDVLDDALDVAREFSALRNATRDSALRVRDGVRATPRFARVSGELLRLVATYRAEAVTRGTRSDLFGDDAVRDGLERLHRSNADRLYELCVSLRGGVLKLGQFVSSRADLLPDAYVRALSQLQDRVPAIPTEDICERVEEEIGAIADVFESFENESLAAASLAQVHGATLAGGTRVVVKVQVPGVDRLVEADLAAFRVTAPALSSLMPGLNLETIAEELSIAVTEELDYVREACNAAEFAACFEHTPEIIVPRIHGELSSRRVLVMERIDGDRIVDWLDACESRGEDGARDRDRLFEILIGSFCAQVLEYGVCHADPHPGNFLVVSGEEGPRLAVLDFGSVQRYSPERRRAWASLTLAILGRDADRMSALFAELGFRSRSGGDDTMRAFAELMLEQFREGATVASFEDANLRAQEVLALVRENPVVSIPGDFVQMGRLFAAIGGLVMRYRPRIDLFSLLAPRVAGALATPTRSS